jgi:hypothetical protein
MTHSKIAKRLASLKMNFYGQSVLILRSNRQCYQLQSSSTSQLKYLWFYNTIHEFGNRAMTGQTTHPVRPLGMFRTYGDNGSWRATNGVRHTREVATCHVKFGVAFRTRDKRWRGATAAVQTLSKSSRDLSIAYQANNNFYQLCPFRTHEIVISLAAWHGTISCDCYD